MRGWTMALAAAGAMFTMTPAAFSQDSGAGAPAARPGDMTLHVLPQSHIDLAWWWRYDPETLEVVIPHTLETAFANFEQYPDYTFTFLQVPAIEPLETRHPDLFYKLRYHAHRGDALDGRIPNPAARGDDGRLAIGGGTYCEFDGCVPSGESMVRQCLHGKRYFLRQFGMDVRTAWFQDAWTLPWTLPQILKKSGMDACLFTRPRNGGGEQMFWWESPDGSRVFAFKPACADGESLPSQAKLDKRLADMHQRYGVNDDIALIGVGNHGGGALRADVGRMKEVMERRVAAKNPEDRPPRLMFSTPAKFVEAVLAGPHSFPVVPTELEPTLRGAYTSVGEIKKGNRYSENLLLTLEKFASVADRLGARPYPKEALLTAWKMVMLNQFHDTISGTDVPPSIDDALRRYAEVAAMAGAELRATLGAITEHIDTTGNGTPIVVFNPVAWDRSDLVEVEFENTTAADAIQLVDEQDRRVAAQILDDGNGAKKQRIAFIAGNVPSLGYKTFWVRPGKAESTALKATLTELENEYFHIVIDPATGCLASVFDKDNNREMLAQPGRGNLIQVLDDPGDSEGFLFSPEGKEEHNIWDGPCVDVVDAPQIRVLENGPVRVALEVKKKHGLARLTQRITLQSGIRRVDFALDVKWQGANKMVKVSFPLDVSAPEATYEIPYGAITRKSRGEEFAAQNWVDVTQDGYGVSLLNDSRYGHDITPNTMRLSVLRSPDHPVAATEEAGVRTVKYALVPHSGTWRQAGIVRRGQEFNNPLIALATTAHTGGLPSAQAFLRVEPENVLLSALKKAEDSDDLILRCYESTGAACTAGVALAAPLTADAVHVADLLENSQTELAATPAGFEAPVGAWAIESYKLIRD
jgi:alpha-mannosidase